MKSSVQLAYGQTCLNMQTSNVFSHRTVPMLTFTAVPAKAPCHISGLNRPLLACLQQNKQSLQLVRDTGDRILLRLLKLPPV